MIPFSKSLDAGFAGLRQIRLPALFCISLMLLLAGAWVRGVYLASDSDAFLYAGQRFIEGIAAGGPAFEGIRDAKLFPHYFISSMLLSGIYRYLDAGVIGVAVFNSILFSLIVCMVFSIWETVCGDRVRGRADGAFVLGAAGGLYIIFGLPDVFLWSYFVLTDTIFLFWITGFTFCIVKGLLEQRRSMWVLGFLMCITAPFVRPTGIIVPVIYLYALYLNFGPGIRSHFRTVVVISVLAPAFFVFFVVPWLVLMAVNDAAAVDTLIPEAIRRHFFQAVHFFKEGVIISTRLEVDSSAPLSYFDIVQSICYRLGYYWVPIRLGERPYSTVHNLVNTLYIIIAWPLLAAGIWRLLNAGRDCMLALLFLVMVAYSYALLHSVTLVSFDWRYQLPAMVPFWILAGCGFYSVLGYMAGMHRRNRAGNRGTV